MNNVRRPGKFKHGDYGKKKIRIPKRPQEKKPSILIVDKYSRPRSPLLTQFYDYISKHFDVVIDERYETPAHEIIQEHYGSGCPDFIQWGFMRGNSIAQSSDFIRMKNIKVIVDLGDTQYFITQHRRNLQKIKVSYILARWPETPGYSHLVTLEDYKTTFPWLAQAKIINVPWGVNPEFYPKPDYDNRPVDVAFICTISDRKFHDTRKLIRDEINKIDGINAKIGSWWGDDYHKLLRSSKISIVEGSKRDFLVQKYLEGPMNGCMLMGEVPTTAKTTLIDGRSIVETDYTDLEEKIRYYLTNDKERKMIARCGRQVMLDNFSLSKTIAGYKDAIWEGFNG